MNTQVNGMNIDAKASDGFSVEASLPDGRIRRSFCPWNKQALEQMAADGREFFRRFAAVACQMHSPLGTGGIKIQVDGMEHAGSPEVDYSLAVQAFDSVYGLQLSAAEAVEIIQGAKELTEK